MSEPWAREGRGALYHGTTTEETAGFSGGQTRRRGLFLTTSWENAEWYAKEAADAEGGNPVVVEFSLPKLAEVGRLSPDYNWLTPDVIGYGRMPSEVGWEEALDLTSHVVYEGPLGEARIHQV